MLTNVQYKTSSDFVKRFENLRNQTKQLRHSVVYMAIIIVTANNWKQAILVPFTLGVCLHFCHNISRWLRIDPETLLALLCPFVGQYTHNWGSYEWSITGYGAGHAGMRSVGIYHFKHMIRSRAYDKHRYDDDGHFQRFDLGARKWSRLRTVQAYLDRLRFGTTPRRTLQWRQTKECTVLISHACIHATWNKIKVTLTYANDEAWRLSLTISQFDVRGDVRAHTLRVTLDELRSLLFLELMRRWQKVGDGFDGDVGSEDTSSSLASAAFDAIFVKMRT